MSVDRAKESFTLLRIITLIVALPLSAVAFLCLRNDFTSGFDLFGAGFTLGFTTAAALCWWFAVCGHIAKTRSVMLYTLKGSLIVGGISFVAGYVGPIIFMPSSNQGPLLGIFVTGPLGFVAGTLLGLCFGVIRVYFVKPSGSL